MESFELLYSLTESSWVFEDFNLSSACTAIPPSISPPSGPQTATRRIGTARPPCSCRRSLLMINAWPRFTYFALSVISNLHLIRGFSVSREDEMLVVVSGELCNNIEPSYALKTSFLIGDISTYAPQSLTLPIPKAPLMFVDIEAGPNQAYIWLISVLVEGKPDSFHLFYAKTPASEGDILNDLSYRRKFNGYTICRYGGFDERIIRRQITTYGLDYSDLDRWFGLQNSINKSGIISAELPSSLKHVADHL